MKYGKFLNNSYYMDEFNKLNYEIHSIKFVFSQILF